MRWILLFAALLSLCGCDRSSNLRYQMTWGSGIGYDVRSVGPDKYEAVVAYYPSKSAQRAKLQATALLRGLTRMKADGYEYALIPSPDEGRLSTTHYSGYQPVATTQDIVLRYTLTGYKASTPNRPRQAKPIDDAIREAQALAQ